MFEGQVPRLRKISDLGIVFERSLNTWGSKTSTKSPKIRNFSEVRNSGPQAFFGGRVQTRHKIQHQEVFWAVRQYLGVIVINFAMRLFFQHGHFWCFPPSAHYVFPIAHRGFCIISFIIAQHWLILRKTSPTGENIVVTLRKLVWQ